MEEIVLASASPRRVELLGALGLRFDIMPSNEDETDDGDLSPECLVERLARRKAAAVAKIRPSATVIGADTVVVHKDRIMGKPTGAEDAKSMLRALQGGEHIVITGVCVMCADKGIELVRNEKTCVRFAPMSEHEIEEYVSTKEPMDKAGAYAIQGKGSLFVTGIDGDYSNVVGLPQRLTATMLAEAGIKVLRP